MSDEPADGDISPEGAEPDVTGPDLARSALARARADARGRGSLPGRADRPRTRTRNVTARLSGPGADDRDPQPLAATLRDLVRAEGWQASVTAGSVIGRWDALVGPDIAAHCRPESVEDGVLVLVAESTAWATQLRLLQSAIIARVNSELGGAIVRSVRVKGPTAPDWRHGPRRVAGRGPRDTYG